MTKEDEQKIADIEKFLKASFCLDGECKHTQFDTVLDGNTKTAQTAAGFSLTDSKRGTFKIWMGVK